MISPTVTIQIPTYNQKQYIKEALDSALAQTYENLQVIVADDCSPNYDIFDYLNEYKDNPKVIIHRNEKNLGRVGNYRNTLYNLVKGKWFVNLDGDDFFINNTFIEKGINSINLSESEIVVLQADALLFKIKENDLENTPLAEDAIEVKGIDYLQYLDNGVGFTHASLLFNTHYAKVADFYNIDVLDADYFSFLKILKYGFIIFCDQKVYEWRQHENQESLSININKILAKDMAFKDLKKNYADVNLNLTKKMFYILNYNLYTQIVNFAFNQGVSLININTVLKKTKMEKKYLIFLATKVYHSIKIKL